MKELENHVADSSVTQAAGHSSLAAQRAIELMRIAAEFVETHAFEKLVTYDGTECDGWCLASDLQVAAEELEAEGKQ